MVALPAWVQEGGIEATVERLREPAIRTRLRTDWFSGPTPYPLDTTTIAMVADPSWQWAEVTWASLNWLLDAASLWCFIAAFGSFANPVGLFAAYGIANVLGAIPVSPAGLGVIDSVTPVLLVGFGLTRSVATLGVLRLAAGELLAAHPGRGGRVRLAQGATGRRAGGYAPRAGRLCPAGAQRPRHRGRAAGG